MILLSLSLRLSPSFTLCYFIISVCAFFKQRNFVHQRSTTIIINRILVTEKNVSCCFCSSTTSLRLQMVLQYTFSTCLIGKSVLINLFS